MVAYLKNLWSDESGQATVEYGLVIAVIAVAAVAVFTLFWDNLEGVFTGIAADVGAAPGDISGGTP